MYEVPVFLLENLTPVWSPVWGQGSNSVHGEFEEGYDLALEGGDGFPCVTSPKHFD